MTNLPSKSVIYTGITDNLVKRIEEHKTSIGSRFTAKYNASSLVYYEEYQDPESAITREKQIKAGSRKAKIKLIESVNPNWKDLGNEL